MKIYDDSVVRLSKIVKHQCNNYWNDDKDRKINLECIDKAASRFMICMNNRATGRKQKVFHDLPVDYLHSVEWSVYLYLLSHELYKSGDELWASKVYYLNKVMHSVDWFYAIELPEYFWAEHPLGSVLGRAKYDDGLFIYQGCTVGGNGDYYPVIGHNVAMLSNSKILGNSHIGNYVIISANAYVIDKDIPDYSIVFGGGKDLVIKTRDKGEMIRRLSHYFKIGE